MANILLIEDDKIVAAMVERFLINGGHTVAVAHDGKAGLTSAAANLPDVVITDLYMPETDGLQTIRELRAKKPSLPIIAISGGGLSERGGTVDILEMARLFGAREVLKKPLLQPVVLDAVARCLAG